jgi:hypothetical protein
VIDTIALKGMSSVAIFGTPHTAARFRCRDQEALSDPDGDGAGFLAIKFHHLRAVPSE